MNTPLTEGEAIILEQLVKVAGGVGCMKEITALTETQHRALQDLKRKGCVMLTTKKFVVVRVR